MGFAAKIILLMWINCTQALVWKTAGAFPEPLESDLNMKTDSNRMIRQLLNLFINKFDLSKCPVDNLYN